jgi:hypothetical protein
MKNLYILPTDKPSRLMIYSTLLNEYRLLDEPISDWKHKKCICITNDDEIKEGDWYLDTFNNQIIKANQFSDHKHYGDACKKIILTTDQDLIKDGVQEIPDEFLEWFVKNPSCESVEVKKDYLVGYYIIPKEEPKQFGDSFENLANVMSMANFMFGVKEEPKQECKGSFKDCFKPVDECVCDTMKNKETLEEAAEKYAESNQYDLEYYDEGGYQGIEVKSFAEKLVDFTTKWQQERSYSEEEAGELVYNVIGQYAKQYGIIIDGAKLNDLFERFKKK